MSATTFRGAVDHFNQNPDHDDEFREYARIVMEHGFRYSVGKLSRQAAADFVANSVRLARYSRHPAFSLVVGYLVPIIANTVIDLIEDHHDQRPIDVDHLLSHVVNNAYGSLQARGYHDAIEMHFPGHGDRGALFSMITLDVLRHSAAHA